MGNELKHEDIFVGMSFKDDDGNVFTVVYIGKIQDRGIPFLVVTGEREDHENNDWLSINELNTMDFLGIQTEPVQLGMARYTDSNYTYQYYGSIDHGHLIKTKDGNIASWAPDEINLINAPKPEIPKEIMHNGTRYVLPESKEDDTTTD